MASCPDAPWPYPVSVMLGMDFTGTIPITVRSFTVYVRFIINGGAFLHGHDNT